MKAKSIKGNSPAEIGSALKESMSDGFGPTLAIVLTSAEKDREAICRHLTESNIVIFGSSSGKAFIDGDIDSNQTVILLLDMKPENFRLIKAGADERTARLGAEQIALAAKGIFKRPAFLLVSGVLKAEGDDIIQGIENICGKGVTIFGGYASDNMKMEHFYVFDNHSQIENGLLALVLDEEKVSLKGMAIGGWKPIGVDRTITKSEGSIVYTIDHEPATDFVMRYTGIKSLDVDNSVELILSSNFQIQLMRENKHPVMRAPIAANTKDHSINFGGAMPEGSKVKLSLLPSFDVIEATIREYSEYKKQAPEADALIMFSCAGRQLSLGPYISEEIQGIRNIWDVPMAGFFCFGEIGRVPEGAIEFHNMTCSLAILKEK